VDDEVRDRAAMYLKVFKQKRLAATYVKEGEIREIVDKPALFLSIYLRVCFLACGTRS
jgi:coatomer protein complex subunit gamma